MRGFVAAALFAAAATLSLAQSVPVVTGDARVDKLLSQMTLEEKLTLIHGTKEDPSVYQGQAGYLAGIPRLHIPGLRFADGPPGVLTRHPSQGETATMGVAATFSIKDAEDNGLVIGREARALGIDVALQPFVNIDRDLEFWRGYNTFGEDPASLPAKWPSAKSKAFSRSMSWRKSSTLLDTIPTAKAPTSTTRHCTKCGVAPFWMHTQQSRRLLHHVLLQPPQRHLRVRQ